MKLNHTTRYVAGLFALVLVAGACAADDPADLSAAVATSSQVEGAGTTEMMMEADDAHAETDTHEEEYAFGAPMDASEASRVIEISTNDNFSFDPKSIDVVAGETITFRVSNPGVLQHDFTIGDAETQAEHEAEMAAMAEEGEAMAAHDEGNAISLAPGETKELTWMFSGSENVLFGCHIQGHFANGMVGTFALAS